MIGRDFDPKNREDLETLTGRRGPKELHAVRRRDFDKIIADLRFTIGRINVVAPSAPGGGGSDPDEDELQQLRDDLAAAQQDILAAVEAINQNRDIANAVRTDHDELTQGFQSTLTETFDLVDDRISAARDYSIARNADFGLGLEGWTVISSANPVEEATNDDAVGGAVLRVTGGARIQSDTRVPIQRDRVYEVVARVLTTAVSSGPVEFSAGVRTYDAQGAVARSRVYCSADQETVPNDGAFREFRGRITGENGGRFAFDPGETSVALYVSCNFFGGDQVNEIDYLGIEDVTAAAALGALIDEVETTLQNADAALAQSVSSVVARIDGVDSRGDDIEATIEENRIARVTRDDALAADIVQLSSSLGGLTATLTQDYLTSVDTTNAIAASRQSLRAELEDPDGASLGATIKAEQVARAAGDQAIAASIETLEGEVSVIEDLARRAQFEFVFDGDTPFEVGSGVTVEPRVRGFGAERTFEMYEATHTRRVASPPTGVYVTIPQEVARAFWSRRIRISVLAKTDNGSPVTTFSVAYGTNGKGDSVPMSLGPTDDGRWVWHSAYYDVPLTNDLTIPHTVIIFPSDEQGGKSVWVSRVRVDVAALAGDLPEIAELSGKIEEVSGLDITADTAFAAWARDIGVTVPDPENPGETLTARTRAFSQALGDVKGNLSSIVGFAAQANDQVALTELIAADGSGRTVSLARTSADTILLDGTVGTEKLVVGTGNNLLPNTEFAHRNAANRPLNWAVAQATGTIGAQTTLSTRLPGSTFASPVKATLWMRQVGGGTSGTFRVACVPDDIATTTPVPPGIVAVEPGEWVEAQARMACLDCDGILQLAFVDEIGQQFGFTDMTIPADNTVSATNPALWPRAWVKAQAPAGAVAATFQISKTGTRAGQADSDVFVHEPQIATTHAAALRPSAYSPGHSTLIDGGRVSTGTLSSLAVDTESFRLAGLGLFGGELRSTNFLSGTRGWTIRANGDAEFNRLIARTDVAIGGLDTENISIGAATVGAALDSDDFVILDVVDGATCVIFGYMKYGRNDFPDDDFENGKYELRLRVEVQEVDGPYFYRKEEKIIPIAEERPSAGVGIYLNFSAIAPIPPGTYRISNKSLTEVDGGSNRDAPVNLITFLQFKR